MKIIGDSVACVIMFCTNKVMTYCKILKVALIIFSFHSTVFYILSEQHTTSDFDNNSVFKSHTLQ